MPSALCANLGSDLSVVVERETCAGKKVQRGVNRFLARRTEQDLVFEDLRGKEGAWSSQSSHYVRYVHF